MLIDDIDPSIGNTGFFLLSAFLSCLAPPTSSFFSALFLFFLSDLSGLQASVSQAHSISSTTFPTFGHRQFYSHREADCVLPLWSGWVFTAYIVLAQLNMQVSYCFVPNQAEIPPLRLNKFLLDIG